MGTPMPLAPTDLAPPTERTELDIAIDRWWAACHNIETWQQEKDAAAAIIMEHMSAGQRYGGLGVARGRRRFSPELAARTLTAAQFAAICEFTPSPKLFQSAVATGKLDAELMDACYEDIGTPFVRRVT